MYRQVVLIIQLSNNVTFDHELQKSVLCGAFVVALWKGICATT